MLLTIVQIIMGTQVREAVDFIAHEHSYIERQFWRADFPIIFYVHRSCSSLILFTNIWLVWKLYQSVSRTNLLFKIGVTQLSLIITAILAGITLDRLGMPAIAQPIHLLMANMIMGSQFFLFICVHYAKTAPSNPLIK
jgi:cytochrome c oxidase assembly protein subunit 15